MLAVQKPVMVSCNHFNDYKLIVFMQAASQCHSLFWRLTCPVAHIPESRVLVVPDHMATVLFRPGEVILSGLTDRSVKIV